MNKIIPFMEVKLLYESSRTSTGTRSATDKYKGGLLFAFNPESRSGDYDAARIS